MDNNKDKREGITQEEPKEQGALQACVAHLEGIRSSVEDVLNQIHWPLWWPWAPIEPFSEEPETDIAETDGEFKVTIELPGVAKENIEISATDDSVELAAVKAEARAQPEGNYISKERGCTSYKRVLALSEEIIPDETKASFENGILTLILKKKPPEPARERVKVEVT